jgi:lysophospholipase L1-like esterase
MIKDKMAKDSTISSEFTKNKLVKENLYSTIPLDSTDIVFLGTGITEPMPLTEFSNNMHIRNHAINGATIKEISRQAQLVAKYHPRKIFIEVGINDIVYNIDDTFQLKKLFIKNYSDMLQYIRQTSPGTKVYLHSILPIHGTHTLSDPTYINAWVIKINTIIKQLAVQYNQVYLDTYSIFQKDGHLPLNLTTDGTHLTAEVYFKWYDYLKPYLKE